MLEVVHEELSRIQRQTEKMRNRKEMSGIEADIHAEIIFDAVERAKGALANVKR